MKRVLMPGMHLIMAGNLFGKIMYFFGKFIDISSGNWYLEGDKRREKT